MNRSDRDASVSLTSEASIVDSDVSSVIGEPVLPPELFVLIVSRLARLAQRATVLEFLCANRACYSLGIPELLRFVSLGGETEKDARWLANFAENQVPDAFVCEDGIPTQTDKFRHVKSLRASLGIREPGSEANRRSSRRTTDPKANEAKLAIVRRCAPSVETLSISLLGSEGHDFFFSILPLFTSLKRFDLVLAGGNPLPTRPIPSWPSNLGLFSLRTYTVPGAKFSYLLDALSASSIPEWALGADIPAKELTSRPSLIARLTRVSKAFREETLLPLLSMPDFKPRVLVIRRGYISSGPASWKPLWSKITALDSIEYLHIPVYQQLNSGIPIISGLPRNLARLAIEAAGVKVEPKRLTKNGHEVAVALASTGMGSELPVLVAKDVGDFTALERRVWNAVGNRVRLCFPGDGEMARPGLEENWRPLDECTLAW